MRKSQEIGSSGGPRHTAMVQATCLRMLQRFQKLTAFQVTFEEHWEIKVQFMDDRFTGYTNAKGLRFRPDIVLRQRPLREERTNYTEPDKWEGLEWSTQIVFEIETDPRRAFKNNRLKYAYYEQITKDGGRGRTGWAFVLVVMDDAKLPEDTAPFDEVWKLTEEDIAPFLSGVVEE